MERVHSFDIFDTLFARTVQNPTDIFDMVEKRAPYPNYKQLRMKAQSKSNHTIENIYTQFQLLTGETKEKIAFLRELELIIEMENTIPIRSNIKKIQDGDILVSDMYFTHDELIQLLNYHTIRPNIRLYVSPGGKANGTMWEKLIAKYTILSHIGDNYHSDITMAAKYNIKGIFTNIHRFSQLELQLVHSNFEMCCFFRKFRLLNPYDEDTLEYKIYDQQAQYYIPLLLFLCYKIETLLLEENRNTVLFLSRDGCLLYKIFSCMYPQYKSVYLHSSRIMNMNYNDEYVSYITSHYNETDCLLFDLHGSFESGRKLFMNAFEHLPRIFIFDLCKRKLMYDKITYITHVSNKIEVLNQDVFGSLVDFTNNTPIRLPNESPIKYIQVMHTTIEQFLPYIQEKKSTITNILFKDDLFWKTYYENTVVPSETILDNTFFHTKRTLSYLTDMHQSSRTNEYSRMYQEIISAIVFEPRQTDINMLEIGLTRKNALVWKDYFYEHIHITGFDVHPDCDQLASEYSNITICKGDQSNEDDVQQFQCNKYDLIIDNGTISHKQKATFTNLWPCVASKGYYIIEHVKYLPDEETCKNANDRIEEWMKGIETIQFYRTLRIKNWDNAFIYVKKK